MEGQSLSHGEISLAHLGVLFLDELPEFNSNTLESLREPLENNLIKINRMYSSVSYPCNFMLIASMNPCPCGYYGSNRKECRCKPYQIRNYINRVSGPLLDRIDIHIEVNEVKYDDLNSKQKPETSETIRQRVNQARELQLWRYKKYNIFSNSELDAKMIEKFCKLDTNSQKLLKEAFEKLDLSARAYTRILKVARTIADLECTENISEGHILEAIHYRSLDRKYRYNKT